MENKSLKYIKYALFIISVIIGILFLVKNTGGEEMVGTILNWAYILLAIAIVLSILLFITALTNGGNIKKMLGVIVVFAILLLIAYLVAPGTEVELSTNVSERPTPGVLKMADTSLILSIILLVVAILAAIGGSFIRRIKN